MLKKEVTNLLWGTDPEAVAELKIAEAERRLNEKRLAVSDMQNELGLIERQTLDTYKTYVMYMLLDNPSVIKKCVEWQQMLYEGKDSSGQALDKRKKYEEKDAYIYYLDLVKRLLRIDDISDVSFVDFSFGEATQVEFSYSGVRWALYIPHVKAIKLLSYRDYGSFCFKLRLLYEDCPGSWTTIGATFEEDELSGIMKKGLEKKESEVCK